MKKLRQKKLSDLTKITQFERNKPEAKIKVGKKFQKQPEAEASEVREELEAQEANVENLVFHGNHKDT